MRLEVSRSVKAALHWPLLVPTLLLLGAGIVYLAGVAIQRPHAPPVVDWHLRQLTGIAVGLAISLGIILVPYKVFVSKAYLLYAGNLLLLALVLHSGIRYNNSTRWLSIFGFEVQPSEFMKLTLVLTLARFIRFRSSYKTFRGLTTPFLLTLLPMALVLKQPDLGTALLCVPILFSMLFVAGARVRHLLIILLLGFAAMIPVYSYLLQPYQRVRVDTFLAQIGLKKQETNQKKYFERRQGFQIRTSKVAVGSGGWTGVGLGEAESHAAHAVPERETDFIFAVVANESGLLGATLLFLFYGAFLLAILAVASRHRDPAGRLICVGVFTLFGFQAFVNLAMAIGLMPVTGLTLPFLSYGRSSLVVSIAAVALVCNVASRPSYEFGRGDFD